MPRSLSVSSVSSVSPASSERRPPNPAGHADDDIPPGLPPMDGDDDEREADPERLDDDEMPKDDGEDPFDDATGEGDSAPELVGLDANEGSLLDASDADGLDIGAADLVGDEGDDLLGDDAPDDRLSEDYGLRDDALAIAADGGEEGPSTLDAEITAEGLPPLDADDDGVQDDAAAFFDEDLARASHDAWSPPWERFGAPLSVPPVRALVRSSSGVLAAGRELVRVDLEGGLERLSARGLRGGELTRVLIVGAALFVTTEHGGLFVSRDGGASFAEVTGWHAHVRPEEAAAGLDVLASASGGLWGRTAQGALLVSDDGGERWEKADTGGFARGLGMDEEGRVVALVRGLRTSELLRRAGNGWRRSELPAGLFTEGVTGSASVAARGRAAAIAVEGDGVFRSVDGGGWSRLAGTERVTAMAMLGASGGVLVAMDGGEGEARCSLLHIGADGSSHVVGTWEERPSGEEGGRAIAVDEAHQVVWVGGGFGMAAFQPRIRSSG